MEVELRLDALALGSDGGYRKRAFEMSEVEGSRCSAMTDRDRVADGAQPVVALN